MGLKVVGRLLPMHFTAIDFTGNFLSVDPWEKTILAHLSASLTKKFF
jgi:hypothetical protein